MVSNTRAHLNSCADSKRIAWERIIVRLSLMMRVLASSGTSRGHTDVLEYHVLCPRARAGSVRLIRLPKLGKPIVSESLQYCTLHDTAQMVGCEQTACGRQDSQMHGDGGLVDSRAELADERRLGQLHRRAERADLWQAQRKQRQRKCNRAGRETKMSARGAEQRHGGMARRESGAEAARARGGEAAK